MRGAIATWQRGRARVPDIERENQFDPARRRRRHLRVNAEGKTTSQSRGGRMLGGARKNWSKEIHPIVITPS